MTISQFVTHIFHGICMGIAEIVPAVSGSTLALVLGIYDRIIEVMYAASQIVKRILEVPLGRSSIRDVWQEIRAVDWPFTISIMIGMFISVFSLVNIIEYVLEAYPRYVYGFFFGLVIMSLSVPWQEITKPKLRHYAIAAVTIGFFWILFSTTPTYTVSDPSLFLLFVVGVIAISAMVLPAVSGSFLLLTFGLYDYILGLVKGFFTFDTTVFLPLGAFTLGAFVGFIVFIRLLKWAYGAIGDELMAFIAGLLIASFRIMWPFQNLETGEILSLTTFSVQEILITCACMLCGMALVGTLKILSVRI